ncbi:MAG: hypothetical protein GY694_04685 [Gammaproteobacteria bacterium]|nr:hypothetical protein [Gammaproteobacteria bacterium]
MQFNSKALESKKQAEAKEKAEQEEQERSKQEKAALYAKFEALSKKEQGKIVKEFEDQLEGFQIKSYQKNGLDSPMTKAMFSHFLRKTFNNNNKTKSYSVIQRTRLVLALMMKITPVYFCLPAFMSAVNAGARNYLITIRALAGFTSLKNLIATVISVRENWARRSFILNRLHETYNAPWCKRNYWILSSLCKNT